MITSIGCDCFHQGAYSTRLLVYTITETILTIYDYTDDEEKENVHIAAEIGIFCLKVLQMPL